MRVVSNTSPIANLAVIGRLELLREQFGEIRIPEAVKAELRNVPYSAAKAVVDQALQESWIRTVPVRQEKLARFLETGLHQGEAEAIALALESAADLVLLDEREGKSAAARLGLRITGVLGILLRAKRTGTVSCIRSELEALRNRAGFFIAPRLEAEVLKNAGE